MPNVTAWDVPAIPMMSRVALLMSLLTSTRTAPPACEAAEAQMSRSYSVRQGLSKRYYKDRMQTDLNRFLDEDRGEIADLCGPKRRVLVTNVSIGKRKEIMRSP